MRKLTLLLAAVILSGCSVGGLLHSFVALDSPPPPPRIPGNPERGEDIFKHGLDDAPPCSTCHQVTAGATGFSLGPNLAGIGERAGRRIEGLAAEDYIHQSILDPRSYLVPGYRDIMYPDYHKHFNENDVADLIAYLMTL